MGRQFQRLKLDNIQVGWGFSAQLSDELHPSRQTLQQLLRQHLTAEQIWRTVILYQVAPYLDQELPQADWHTRVNYVKTHIEAEEKLLMAANDRLLNQNRRFLLVFDALDRLGNDWAGIRNLLQGLLRVCLDLRALRAIHVKLFLRPDMWTDPVVWAFPDASRLQHTHAGLTWRPADLYGLLWYRLVNSEAGAGVRQPVRLTLNLYRPSPVSRFICYRTACVPMMHCRPAC